LAQKSVVTNNDPTIHLGPDQSKFMGGLKGWLRLRWRSFSL